MLADTRWGWCILCVALAGCVEGGIGGDAGPADAGTFGVGPIGWCPALATCDDGDPCTDGDLCEDGECVGVPRVCETPPGQCYLPDGTCSEGACVYPTRVGGCDDGDSCTVRDRCEDGACAGTPITCQAPPPPRCLDSDTLRSFVRSGRCAEGRCIYQSVDALCPGGSCRGGECECSPEAPGTTVVDSGFGLRGGFEPALFVDDTDELHLSYHDPLRGTLRYGHRAPSGGWVTELVDPAPGSGLGSSIETMGEDVYITYEQSPQRVALAARRSGSSAWQLERVAETGGFERATPDLAVSPSSTVHVVFASAQAPGVRSLGYAVGAMGEWRAEVLDANGDTGLAPMVWLDPSVQVLYREGVTGMLKTALKSSGLSWSSSTFGSRPALLHAAAVDRLGAVHVVYGDPTSGDWIYARRDRVSSPWVDQTLPSTIEPKADLALWAGPGGDLHLAYRASQADATSVSYRYAHRTRAGTWSDREIAAFESSGGGTAIAVDSTGRAHIALSDGSAGTLQVISLRVCE